ncbi:mannosyltransferase [Streptacidiphilus sp. MAP12-20]|uniref:glycosyltransferase family 39 protein n=1 Tax=Streptacidiphilus sp. MAP12-20 TaxID=3156299 RepID=UPI003516397D
MLLRRLPVWAPPALLALLLGAWQLGRPLLWRDELASWSAARRSLGQLWGLLDHVDAVSGFYYFFLHFWMQLFGDSPVSLRLPSVLMTGVTAGLTAVVGKRLFGTRVGIWAGLLFAVVPLTSRYAQEARAYAMVSAAVLLSTWLLLRILDCQEDPGRRRTVLRWLGYAGSVVLVGMLHLVALSVLTAHLWLLITHRRRAWRGFLPATLLALLALTPLLAMGRDQAERQISWVTRPNPFAFPGLLHELVGSWAVLVVLLALSAVACLRRPGLRYLPVPVLPVVTVWIVSQGSSSYWVERYLLFVLPLWTILAAVGVDRLPWGRWTAPAALVLVAALAVPAQLHSRTPWAHTSTDWPSAAKIIASGYEHGDAIVPERGGAARYMDDLGIAYYLPSSVKPHDLFAAVPAAERDDLLTQECAAPATCLTGAPRVWVVTFDRSSNPLSPLPVAQRAALTKAYKVSQVDYVNGLTIGLLTLRR